MTEEKITFAIHPFFRRQTEESKFSYFDGPDQKLLDAAALNFPLRRPGKRQGFYIIPIAAQMGDHRCYTAVVPVGRHHILNAEVIAQSSVDCPLICASVVARKLPASYAELIVLSHDALKSLSEASSKADYEIVSLNASDVERPPEHPYEIARQVLREGAAYTPKEICDAIMYWGTHAFAKQHFHKHINHTIADLIKSGDIAGALKLRRKMVPEESAADSDSYVQTVMNFLTETGQFYD